MSNTPPRIRIVLVDDHPIVRRGLVDVLGAERDFDVVAEGADGRAAIELYRQHKPDVLVIDLDMPQVTGAEVTRRRCREDPDARILVLTVHAGEGAVTECLEAGARGYVLKRAAPDELIAAIRAISGGRRALDPALGEAVASQLGSPKLTARELEVLAEMAQGKDNREIAAELGITEGTTRWFITSILAKLGVKDRTKAVVVALRRGLVRL